MFRLFTSALSCSATATVLRADAPIDVGSRSRDRGGRSRCVVKCVGGRGPAPDQESGARPTALPGVGSPISSTTPVTSSAIPAHQEVATCANGNYAVSPAQVAGRGPVLWIDANGSDPRPRPSMSSGPRAHCRCQGADSGLRWRRMARRAGRGAQGARHDNQNGSPSHAMTITLPPGVPPLPAHTPTGQDAPGWWPSAGANRLGRQVGRFQMRAHHGRSTVSSPTPVGESVPASGVQNLGEASVGAKPRSDK